MSALIAAAMIDAVCSSCAIDAKHVTDWARRLEDEFGGAFDTTSEQKRDEMKPTRPLTASAMELLRRNGVHSSSAHLVFNDPTVAQAPC